MASIPTFAPTATGNFDPTQWSNPYSLFNAGALPWPSTYAGAPTNAMGQPIASYQAPAQPAAAGLTLNSTPPFAGAGPNAGVPGTAQYQLAQNPALALQMYQANPQNMIALQDMIGQARQPAAAPAAAAQGAPNNWNSALAALANPGNPVTPGATVPQAAQNYQPGPGVLQQFLQNWQPAQGGPGAGFQQAFANALRGGR